MLEMGTPTLSGLIPSPSYLSGTLASIDMRSRKLIGLLSPFSFLASSPNLKGFELSCPLGPLSKSQSHRICPFTATSALSFPARHVALFRWESDNIASLKLHCPSAFQETLAPFFAHSFRTGVSEVACLPRGDAPWVS